MKLSVVALALPILALGACGKTNTEKAQAAAGVTIANGWCRASPQGAASASCFLTIRNGGATDDRLVGGESSAAKEVRVNETFADGNILRMRPVESLTIPAHKAVAMAPGGYVLRLNQLSSPLIVGSTVPVTLKFDAAGDKQNLFPVRVEAEAEG